LKLILLHGSYAKNPIGFETLLVLRGGDLAEIFGDNKDRERDLKSLHKADPLFVYQVTCDCLLIYGKQEDYNNFRAYAFKVYYDAKDLFLLEKHLIDKYRRYLNQKYA
jgi:hypothetical protein